MVLTKEGEGTFERSKVDMGFEAVAASFDQYLAGDTFRREDAQWTLFVTEGNLGVVGNRLVGDQASGEWAKEDSEDLPELIELWVALRETDEPGSPSKARFTLGQLKSLRRRCC